MPEDSWLRQQVPSDLPAWYALGNERVGRHGATAPDLNETLLLPPVRGESDPDQARPRIDPRPAGKHASAQIAEAGRPPADDTKPGSDSAPSPDPAAGPEPAGPEPAGGPDTTANGRSVTSTVTSKSAAAAETSKLRLVWVYPDLLSTYGDRGNLLVLSRRALATAASKLQEASL